MRQYKPTQSRHLAALFTFFTLLPLVHYIPPWLTFNVSEDQRVVTFLAVAIIVPIVSYIALPLLFKLIRFRK